MDNRVGNNPDTPLTLAPVSVFLPHIDVDAQKSVGELPAAPETWAAGGAFQSGRE